MGANTINNPESYIPASLNTLSNHELLKMYQMAIKLDTIDLLFVQWLLNEIDRRELNIETQTDEA